MTATTPIRARLRAARDRRRAEDAVVLDRPYSWRLLPRANGLWTVVVRVTATGQELPVTHAARPDDDDCARIAARLYDMRRTEEARR